MIVLSMSICLFGLLSVYVGIKWDLFGTRTYNLVHVNFKTEDFEMSDRCSSKINTMELVGYFTEHILDQIAVSCLVVGVYEKFDWSNIRYKTYGCNYCESFTNIFLTELKERLGPEEFLRVAQTSKAFFLKLSRETQFAESGNSEQRRNNICRFRKTIVNLIWSTFFRKNEKHKEYMIKQLDDNPYSLPLQFIDNCIVDCYKRMEKYTEIYGIKTLRGREDITLQKSVQDKIFTPKSFGFNHYCIDVTSIVWDALTETYDQCHKSHDDCAQFMAKSLFYAKMDPRIQEVLKSFFLNIKASRNQKFSIVFDPLKILECTTIAHKMDIYDLNNIAGTMKEVFDCVRKAAQEAWNVNKKEGFFQNIEYADYIRKKAMSHINITKLFDILDLPHFADILTDLNKILNVSEHANLNATMKCYFRAHFVGKIFDYCTSKENTISLRSKSYDRIAVGCLICKIRKYRCADCNNCKILFEAIIIRIWTCSDLNLLYHRYQTYIHIYELIKCDTETMDNDFLAKIEAISCENKAKQAQCKCQNDESAEEIIPLVEYHDKLIKTRKSTKKKRQAAIAMLDAA